MYEKISPSGVVLRSCRPFAEPRLRDRNPVVFLLWSWSFTVRNNIGGLFKKGEW